MKNSCQMTHKILLQKKSFKFTFFFLAFQFCFTLLLTKKEKQPKKNCIQIVKIFSFFSK
eukprot:TRINITY_DN9077_c0_g1_i1.p2 TRINITY_DN9077_c0_g1~~TRINITY_DN9077_c0_g1_i1.p2  ORF type:complete len:59 (+),score=10.89 TRINITY_DN9077_c0_g1_i1:2-178(+)